MKEEEKGIDCCLPKVEVVAIYPNPNKQKNRIKEAGTCHISVKDLGLDIKNIVYLVNNDGAILHLNHLDYQFITFFFFLPSEYK